MSIHTRLDWLDIGYEKLDAIADYKVLLFQHGQGAGRPVILRNYPRWSDSLWDLVARAIARALSPEGPSDTLPRMPESPKHIASATHLSAMIEHYPEDNGRKRVLSTAEIWRHGRAKACYRARFEEDLMPVRQVERFFFRPERLRPAELIMRAALLRLHGSYTELPPMPGLVFPKVLKNGKEYVNVCKLPQPARGGLLRWVKSNSEPPEIHRQAPDGIVPMPTYMQFLARVV
ncbi:MAG: hypothetical protein U1F10_13565 [Burkholderiales bacterium]